MEPLSLIGSLASVASLLLQVGVPMGTDGRPAVGEALRGVYRRLSTGQRRALAIPGSEAVLVLLIIDRSLLDDLESSVKRCLDLYRSGLRKAQAWRERELADRRAERCVCENLNRIRARNGGALPDGPFENWWKSYRCVSDDFEA